MNGPALASLALVLLAAAGCASSSAGDAALPEPGSRWRLARLGEQSALADVEVTLVFEEEGKISGSAGCNRYFGEARLEQGRLALGPIGSTKRMCLGPGMEQETRYLRALAEAERLERTAKQLILRCGAELGPLVFEPAAEPAESD